MKPRPVSRKEFDKASFPSEIGLGVVGWGDVVGHPWGHLSDEELYKKYVDWWTRENTKLGQLLNEVEDENRG